MYLNVILPSSYRVCAISLLKAPILVLISTTLHISQIRHLPGEKVNTLAIAQVTRAHRIAICKAHNSFISFIDREKVNGIIFQR